MGTAITVLREDGAFAVTREGWYLPRPHLGSIDHSERDFVGVAEQFIARPICGAARAVLASIVPVWCRSR